MAMNDKKLATTANQSLAHTEPYVAETVILLDPRTESVPTKPWWDGQLTVALMTAGIAIPFILAILLEARNPN